MFEKEQEEQFLLEVQGGVSRSSNKLAKLSPGKGNMGMMPKRNTVANYALKAVSPSNTASSMRKSASNNIGNFVPTMRVSQIAKNMK